MKKTEKAVPFFPKFTTFKIDSELADYLHQVQLEMGGRYYQNQLRELIEFPLVPMANHQGWDQPYYDDWKIIFDGLNKLDCDVEKYDLDKWKFYSIVDGVSTGGLYLHIFSEDVELYKFVGNITRDKKKLNELEKNR